MDLTVQISTGLPGGPGIDETALMRKLTALHDVHPITCALIGWNHRAWPTLCANWMRDNGVQVYLWLPVFSGWDGLSPLIGRSGRLVEQAYRSEQGERFDFGCPANPANVTRVLQVFDRWFADQRYDGVFLDKIRFPSFVDGLPPVLTCGCDSCVARFGERPVVQLGDTANPLGLLAYRRLTWDVADEAMAALLAYKAQAVTESVRALTEAFRERGYHIGLDLFAPFLSRFVGQDYEALLPLADFVKPMLYRLTDAPAGIPFEIHRYATAFSGSDDDAGRRRAALLAVLGTSAIDLDFVNRELAAVKTVAGDALIYAGFETNRSAVAPVTPAYVRENMAGLRADGLALSWDLNSTPDDNFRAVLDGLA